MIFNELSYNSSVTVLCVGKYLFIENGFLNLKNPNSFNFLKTNKTITHLNLGYVEFKDEEMRILDEV